MKPIMSNYLKNSKGFTLIELMIAAVIAIIVLAGTIQVFTYQASTLKDENDNTKVRAKGRQAMKILAREIRMAGFGLPDGQGIITINPNQINFRTNKNVSGDKAVTFVDSSAGNVAGPTTSLTIVPGTAFNGGDNIAIFNPNEMPAQYFLSTVGGGGVSDSDITMTISPGLAADDKLTFSDFAKVVMVSRYSDYQITLAGENIVKTVDGVAVTLVNNVQATADGLKFDYLNGLGVATTNPSAVRRVAITLNMLDPQNSDASIEFKTVVQIRNSGT